jgi:hypothetical protein
MGLICTVKFMEKFKDGNIIARAFKAGEITELDEALVERIRQSGGMLEVMEKRVPPPQKAGKDAN